MWRFLADGTTVAVALRGSHPCNTPVGLRRVECRSHDGCVGGAYAPPELGDRARYLLARGRCLRGPGCDFQSFMALTLGRLLARCRRSIQVCSPGTRTA